MLEDGSKTEIFKSEISCKFELSLVSYGVNIGIQTNNSDIFDRIRDYLPPGWQPASFEIADKSYSLIVGDRSEGVCYQLYREREKLLETARLEEVLDIFNSDLRLQVAIAVKDQLFVHAGVVGWQGKAIAIPGRSFSGKTTLVAALVKAGATYYSDEYAVFDADGRVHPYPRPLSVRQGTGKWVKQSVEELGGRAGQESLPLGFVIQTQYQSRAVWYPQEISRGEAVLALLDNTIIARIRPEFALKILSRAVSETISFESKRGEAEKIAVEILKHIESF